MFLVEVGFIEIQGMLTVILFGLFVYVLTELTNLKREIRAKEPATASNSLLALQAYERIALLVDRISLKNLVARMHSNVFTTEEFEAGLVETIKNEYEHNITQQIYINTEVWKAVTKLKDQNIYIINQLTAALPSQSNAVELSKMIIEYTLNNNAELSTIVLDAIQYEVKKLM